MIDQDKKDLQREIDHIDDSGYNSERVFNMVVDFIDKRYINHGIPKYIADQVFMRQQVHEYMNHPEGERMMINSFCRRIIEEMPIDQIRQLFKIEKWDPEDKDFWFNIQCITDPTTKQYLMTQTKMNSLLLISKIF